LQQVAADAGHVAQLRRGGLQERLRKHGVILHHQRVLAHVAHAFQRANAQAVGRLLNAFEGHQVDVDQLAVVFHVQLHQIKHRGAARDESRAFGAGYGGRGVFGRGGGKVGEVVHGLVVSCSLSVARLRNHFSENPDN
jgi:hypothetical protein